VTGVLLHILKGKEKDVTCNFSKFFHI